jgi:hypothetical protein
MNRLIQAQHHIILNTLFFSFSFHSLESIDIANNFWFLSFTTAASSPSHCFLSNKQSVFIAVAIEQHYFPSAPPSFLRWWPEQRP